MADIEFRRIADAALAQVETLLSEWLPDGHRQGHEYKATNPTRADHHAGSFSINTVTGAWGDFATDEVGGDLLSLYAYLFCNGDQVAAAKDLSNQFGMPDAVPPLEKEKKGQKPKQAPPPPKKEPKKSGSGWKPILPVPDDAPPPLKAHQFRGIPQLTWCYRDASRRVLGYVYRFENSSGGKEIIPLTWCCHEETGAVGWRWLSFSEPRPLYGLDNLADNPSTTVLVVEGEKCVAAAQIELPDLVVISWPGGGGAVDKADWTPLAGRRVITWGDTDSQRAKVKKGEPDSDPLTQPYLPLEKQPGYKAMAKVREILQGLGCKLWDIPLSPPGEKPDGWDVADVIADGMQGVELAEFVRLQAQLVHTESISTPPEAGAGKSEDTPPDYGDDGYEEALWRDRLICKRGEIDDCLSNVYDFLKHREEWKGVLAFDEFAMRTVKRKPPPYPGGKVGEWDSYDDSMTAIWLTKKEGITPSSTRVMEAVETLAFDNRWHPVRSWLLGLPAWDQTQRLDYWISDYLGVTDSPYVRLVSRYYLMGMIGRVMKPGSKFDYCLVLEGKQGKGKSSALRILGGEWYADTDLDLHNKDSMSALQGVLLYEFAELGSVARAEATKQKSFLSRQVDKYRPVYGRRDIQAPRQVVFAGSTNDWEWNKDPTGGRRFWPVECQEALNLQGLIDNRDQLFAEALVLYQAGEQYWPTPEQQEKLFDPEQLRREQPDSLVDALHDWVYVQVKDFSVAMAVMEGLKMDASKLTRDLQTRVGIALRKLGCTKVEKRNGMIRYWYKPPTRNVASSEVSAEPAQADPGPSSGGHHAPF